MKQLKVEFKKNNGLLALFFVAGFFLLSLSYLSPQNPFLQIQSWRKKDHIFHQVNITAANTTTTKTSNYQQKHNTTVSPLGVDKKLPEKSDNKTTTETNNDTKKNTTNINTPGVEEKLPKRSHNITTTRTNNDTKKNTTNIKTPVIEEQLPKRSHNITITKTENDTKNTTKRRTPDGKEKIEEDIQTTSITSNKEGSRETIQEVIQAKPICDFSDPRSNLCNMTGDVRLDGNINTVYLVPPPNTFFSDKQEWNFSPQSRRIIRTMNVTVKHLHSSQYAPDCTIKSDVPAMVFSLGGLVGNIWHDFSDIIIPLVLASKPLKGNVQFVIRDYFPWFVEKYSLILKDLSHYDIVNFDKDKEVRCYSHATVGLLNHGDLGINPARAFDGFDLFRFRLYMREIFSLPPFWVDIPYKLNPQPDKKPRLMLVLRAGIRKFLNEEEVKELIISKGFELVVVEPKKNVNLIEFSKLVDSCDVLMGVHGAALTNFFFLRTNAIMIQIIQYGHIDNFAFWYYGSQALAMKLRKIDYTIIPEESSLLEKYGWDHPVIKDPDSVNSKGYRDRMKYYWYEQNIKLNVTRFEPVLAEALKLLQE